MNFVSIKNPKLNASFQQAVFTGLASDGSLFIPETLPHLAEAFLQKLSQQTLNSIADTVAKQFIHTIPEQALSAIVARALNFTIPLVQLEEHLFLLELFHGPTLAFKDVGARFLAEVLAHFLEQEGKRLTLIVATSGDTGSAVAHGFYQIPNVDVYVLYPSGRVSPLQEQQMATLGKNIHAIEIQGNFDACQALVKQALNDTELAQPLNLTTANSINLGRLIPQISYYGWAIAQWQRLQRNTKPIVVVPSGNFGNLTAAVYAKRMGIPIQQFIAATNANAVVPEFFASGKFTPRNSVATVSNAMDVGDPSNFPRLETVYQNDLALMRQEIKAVAVSDIETLSQIKATYQAQHYLLDPHTAVGVVAAKQDLKNSKNNFDYIIAATAHPAKFSEVIANAIGVAPEIPERLQQLINKPKQSVLLPADYTQLKNYLLAANHAKP